MEYQALKPADVLYPRRLKERLGGGAPVLYARGSLEHLNRWTLAFFTADNEPGNVTRAVWDMFFPVLKYEMNAIGAWQSVNEGVFFRSALEKPWISLTLFTVKGLERETYESFIDARHQKPFDSFLQRPEYDRRATAGELLMLSISSPKNGRQSHSGILERNFVACQLADVVFIGGAARKSKLWSSDRHLFMEKRQKTFTLAQRLLKSGARLFTVDHKDNQELKDLGVPTLTPKTVGSWLDTLGAKKAKPESFQPIGTVPLIARRPRDQAEVVVPPRPPKFEQPDLFDPPARPDPKRPE